MQRTTSNDLSDFGAARGAWRVEVSDPRATVCLQATDYFLWTVQRFYERHEARFMDVLWPRIGEIHDLYLGGGTGTFFRGEMTSMTYQAASGAGAAHMRELAAQMATVGEAVRAPLADPASSALAVDRSVRDALADDAFPRDRFGAPLAASLLPWIDRPLDGGRSREEGKAFEEGNNILGNEPPLPIDGAYVRVGSMRCHAQACTIKLREDRPIDEIEALIDGAHDWMRVVENTPEAPLAELTPAAVSGRLEVAVGRIRKLRMGGEYLTAFTVGDHLLWGAAEPLRRMLGLLRSRCCEAAHPARAEAA